MKTYNLVGLQKVLKLRSIQQAKKFVMRDRANLNLLKAEIVTKNGRTRYTFRESNVKKYLKVYQNIKKFRYRKKKS